MGRRVKPGDKLTISAAEYNRLLAAADVARVVDSKRYRLSKNHCTAARALSAFTTPVPRLILAESLALIRC